MQITAGKTWLIVESVELDDEEVVEWGILDEEEAAGKEDAVTEFVPKGASRHNIFLNHKLCV